MKLNEFSSSHVDLYLNRSDKVKIGTSVWDAKANKGEGGYRFADIVILHCRESIEVHVIGDKKCLRKVKILKEERDKP